MKQGTGDNPGTHRLERNKPVRSPEERGGIAAAQFSISLLQHNRPQQALN